jgi:hypothetical protein
MPDDSDGCETENIFGQRRTKAGDRLVKEKGIWKD